MTFLPIVDRELRVVARRPSTQWLRFGVALALIVVVLLGLVGSSPYAPPHRLAQELMQLMGVPALGFCLLAGVFLTADCLSQERREGTLGLLFLTDLKGYDVTLGKLAATSVHAFYGLLATFPVMALPLLMGGVSVGQFGRLLLILLVTLFLSLSAGMVVSSISQETRHAMLGTFVLMVLWTGAFPALWLLLHLFLQARLVPNVLLLPSPFCAYVASFDSQFRRADGPVVFWISLGLSAALGLALLAWATWRVPRIWQDRDLPGRSPGRRSFPDFLRYGTPARRTARRAWLAENPFYWLTTRRRLGQVLAWVMVGGLGAVWGCFFGGAYAVSARGQREELFVFSVLVAFGLHSVFKILVALEATSRLSEDRQSGVLELLLATPLSPLAIVHGQRRALRERYGPLMLAVALVNLALFWAILAQDPFHLGSEGRFYYSAALLGGIALLFLDSYALSWVGPWLALRSRRQHLAVLGTLGRLMLPSWVALFMFGFLVANTWVGNEEAVKALTTAWFVGSAVLALYAATHARRRLLGRFRSLAAGTPRVRSSGL